MVPKRRITGKQPPPASRAARADPVGPLLAKGLPKRATQVPPIQMPGMLPKIMKRLEARKAHQGLVDFQQNQRMHERARNVDNELVRLGTMAGGYLPSLRSGLQTDIQKLLRQRREVAQKIRDSRK